MTTPAPYIVILTLISLLLAACTPFTNNKTEIFSPQAEIVEKVLAKHRKQTGELSATDRHQQRGASLPFSQTDKQTTLEGKVDADYNCSWFYFLWGSQAEYDKRYEEAYQSYEKALACDPGSMYIESKFPILLLKMHRYKEAAAWLNNILKQYPENQTYLELLANIYFKTGKINEALSLYERLLTLSPENESIVCKLAIIYSQQKRYNKATALLTSYLEQHSQTLLSRLTLARIYTMHQKLNKAIQEYKTVLEYHKGNSESVNELALLYQLTRQNNEAEKLYRRTLDNNKQDERTSYALINMLASNKRYNDALTELDRLRLFSSNTVRVDFVRSQILIEGNRAKQAKALLKNLVQSEMHNNACYLLGKTLYLEGKIKKAQQYLNQVEHNSQPFPGAAFILTKIKYQKGDKKGMVSYLRQCIADTKNDSPLFHLMLFAFFMEEKQKKIAQKVLVSGLERYPNDTHLLYRYAILHEKQGHHTKATETMKKIIALDPEHPAALNFVGYRWADRNENLEEALLYLQKAVQLKPKDGFILDSLGWVLFRMRQYDNAIKTLIRAHLLVPEKSLICEHIGDVYQEIGNIRKATKWYQDAIKKAKNDVDRARIEYKLNNRSK